MQLRQVIPQGSLWGTMPDGTVVIVDRRASPDPAGEYTVLGLKAATDTIFSRRYPYRATPIGESARDSLTTFLIADMPEVSQRELQAAMDIPRFEPPVSAMVVGRDASIWLRREQLGREVVEWNVLDERGIPVGIVDVPANVRIAEAQRNRVWGVQTDELGVPYVVRFRVEPLF